jgi:hypothetical protein
MTLLRGNGKKHKITIIREIIFLFENFNEKKTSIILIFDTHLETN